MSLIAEQGDVVLEGSIVVLSAEPSAGSPSNGRSRAMGAAASRATASARGAPGLHGGGIVVEATTGNVVVGATHFMISGDGGPAQDVELAELAVDSASETIYSAPSGGDGGNIVLRAPLGAVVFRLRDPTDPPPFHLGNGGTGASLYVAPDLRVASERVGLGAGDGGNSGVLRIDALRVEGASGVARFFAQGRGGDGGTARWIPSASPALPTNLESFGLAGGDGGRGMRSGGRGGDAEIDGQAAMHDPQSAPPYTWTMFVVLGGGGGSVDRDALLLLFGRQDEFRGGRGGDTFVIGHRGWPGGPGSGGDGAHGGSVFAVGGHGGAVIEHANARGGRGGDVRAISGEGGAGEDRCGTGAGGRGGNAGDLLALGGGGGNVIAAAAGGRVMVGAGGDGGHVKYAEVGRPGRGGRGSPPGAAGDEGVVNDLQGGEGGEGADLGFLGSIPEVVFGLAPLPDPCDDSAPDICDPPSPKWMYQVDASLTFGINANGSRTVGSTEYEVDVSQSMTVGASGIYPSLASTPPTARARVKSISRSPSGLIEVLQTGAGTGTGDPSDPFYGVPIGVEVSLDRQSCTWNLYTTGGRLRTEYTSLGRTREVSYQLGSVRLRGVPATGSRELAFDECHPWGTVIPCGHWFGDGQSYWSSAMGSLAVPPPMDVRWSISVVPVKNPHYAGPLRSLP